MFVNGLLALALSAAPAVPAVSVVPAVSAVSGEPVAGPTAEPTDSADLVSSNPAMPTENQPEPSFCGEVPLADKAASVGKVNRGHLRGAVELQDTSAVRVLPLRHKARCLNWSTPRMVRALEHAGATVQQRIPGSPALGVGDLSRARGGSIVPLSHSHQSGRDADLAFYQLDQHGQPTPALDLFHFDEHGRANLDDGSTLQFDAPRNWALVRALLEDSSIEVRFVFISEPLRTLLLDEARREGTPAELLARASALLHQPNDAPPHDDHLHLRIRCTREERLSGCSD
jgi:penicillin-insensitive murein endopeptidase